AVPNARLLVRIPASPRATSRAFLALQLVRRTRLSPPIAHISPSQSIQAAQPFSHCRARRPFRVPHLDRVQLVATTQARQDPGTAVPGELAKIYPNEPRILEMVNAR